MIYPKFLWDNILRGITPTFSGTTITGKEPSNATDWRDFSYFSADSGNLDYVISLDTSIDSVCFYVANFTGTGSETIVLQYESSPSTFTTLATLNPSGGKLSLIEFTQVTVLAGRKIRFVVTVGTGTLLIRQLVVGAIMQAEQGQYKDVIDPILTQGVKITNTISTNGSLIGRSIKRLERSGNIKIQNLSASWVRTTWEPFVKHASRYPFIYAWNTRDYPNSISFSFASRIMPAQNNGKGDRMDVSWKVSHLVADENAV